MHSADHNCHLSFDTSHPFLHHNELCMCSKGFKVSFFPTFRLVPVDTKGMFLYLKSPLHAHRGTHMFPAYKLLLLQQHYPRWEIQERQSYIFIGMSYESKPKPVLFWGSLETYSPHRRNGSRDRGKIQCLHEL